MVPVLLCALRCVEFLLRMAVFGSINFLDNAFLSLHPAVTTAPLSPTSHITLENRLIIGSISSVFISLTCWCICGCPRQASLAPRIENRQEKC